VLTSDGERVHGRTSYQLGVGANSLILLHRTAFVTDDGALHKDASRALLRWAVDQQLGQDATLLRQVAARRERALRELCAQPAATPVQHARIHVRPQWRLAVGLGNKANPYEIGLSLHGSYGWPVIPGSTLKGLTRAWAQQSGAALADPGRFDTVFGPAPGPGRADDKQGSVVFLDALPVGEPPTITLDVVTPHVGPYYRNPTANAPAEYHNPVPAQFLTVSAGRFAVDLVGAEPDVTAAARWCAEAVDALGVGGKTSAGYGYLVVDGAQE
jgi:CRISPR-associated protein Cmr6